MEFIIELIGELLFEIILEGTIELGTSKKVPLPVRILLLLLFVALFGFIIGAIALIGITAWKDGNTLLSILMLAIDVLIVTLMVFAIAKKYRENNKSK